MKSSMMKCLVVMALVLAVIAGSVIAQTTITVWHAYAGQADKVAFIEEAIRTFREKYPDIHIDEVPVEHSAYKVKLNTAMATANPPDVFYSLPGGVLGAFVDAGLVYSLDEELAEDGWGNTFMESALARVTHNGRVYAVPIDVDAVVMWYNAELFRRHGLSEPETYEEFLALCDELKSKGIIPVALGNRDMWPGTFWFQYLTMRLKGSGIVDGFLAGDPDVSFNTPEVIRAGEIIHELVQRGTFPMGLNGMSETEADMLFFTGRAAMTLDGTWQIGQTASGAPAGFEMDFFPFPVFADGNGDPSDVLAGVAATFAISEKCEDKEAAVLFLQHLTSMEMAQLYVEIRQTLVCKKDAVTEDNAGPVLFSISKLLEDASNLDHFFDTAMPPRSMQTYYNVVQGLLGRTMTPSVAARTLDQAVRDAVE